MGEESTGMIIKKGKLSSTENNNNNKKDNRIIQVKVIGQVNLHLRLVIG